MKTPYVNDCIDLYLQQFVHSTPDEKEYIRKHLSVEAFEKGNYFLQTGEIQKNMAFVCKGLIRRFYVNDKGNQVTTGFTKEEEHLTDYPAFIRQTPTKYFFQFLEPGVLVKLPYDVIQKCYTLFKNSEMQGRFIAEKVLTILSDRVESFLFNTAEERYLKFIKDNPELIHRVSLTHLASFLGIERQSLSRIRSKIARK